MEEKILTDSYPAATHGEIGVLRHGLRQSREAYIDHLAGTIESDLSGPVSYTHLDVYKRQVLSSPAAAMGIMSV